MDCSIFKAESVGKGRITSKFMKGDKDVYWERKQKI